MFSKIIRRSVVSAVLKESFTAEGSAIKAAGTWKDERQIISKQGAAIRVRKPCGTEINCVNFCANNYLGLSAHPEVVDGARAALESHGAGLSSVRFICGTQDIHLELEKRLAKLHGTDDAILYAACFDANAGIFEVILGKDDAVISDSLNHASIIDGIRLCKAQRKRYVHMDLADLEAKLIETANCRRRLVVTDGVFSMDGDIAPLDEIKALCDKYDAMLMIDECHATGILGEKGRGTDELFGIHGQVDIINSTLGKALGGASGGYTAGPQEIVNLLRQKARPYLFSNTLAPPVVGAALSAIDLLETKPEEFIGEIQRKTKLFRSKMTAAGFNIMGKEHPISPVFIGEARLAADLANKLLDCGIFVIAFSYPVVPEGKARIRVQISAAHSDAQIDQTVDAFVRCAKELNILD